MNAIVKTLKPSCGTRTLLPTFLLLASATMVALATACSLFTPTPDLVPIGELVVNAKGEALEISWQDVPNAESYHLYYTDDGTDPNLESPKLANVAAPYLHSDLDEEKSYKYLLVAEAAGYKTAVLPGSVSTMPKPMMHLTCTFPNYANKPVLFLGLLIPFNPTSGKVEGNSTTNESLALTTDSNGLITGALTIDYESYWGYTLAKDLNYDGVLSSGDEVWGSGTANPGYFSYRYWSSKAVKSRYPSAFVWNEEIEYSHIF